MSAADLERLTEGIGAGIRDTPAWQRLVQQHGEAEATRILRLAIYSGHGIHGDRKN
jgi:hypothetical protein